MFLSVSSDLLRTVASNIQGKAEEFASLLKEIQEANAELANSWEGTNATSYTTKVAEQAENLQQLQQAITKVSEFLNGVAKVFDQVESDTTLR